MNEKPQGIDVGRLPKGTKFLVQTRNNLYTIEKLDYGSRVMVQGGKYFPEPTEVSFPGSTYGGSCIRLNWIGYGMQMEFHIHSGKHNRIITSGVREALIMAPGYEYLMEWEKDSEHPECI